MLWLPVMRTDLCLVTVLASCFSSLAVIAQAPQGIREDNDAVHAIAQSMLSDGTEICSVVSASLVPGLPADILVSVDASGRHFCNEVWRITRSGRPAVADRITVWGIENVRDALHDLDHDGHTELVFRRAITTYEGADCIATTPVVYQCSAIGCSDTRDRHVGFLTEELHKVEQRRDEAEQRGSERDREGLPCTIVAVDKLRRRLGVDPQAGADVASRWMKDPDPKLRRKAVAVFADIGDEDARRKLAVLAADADRNVAFGAEVALKKK